MRIIDDFEKISPVKLTHPETQTLPIVFNSPHSGRDYPRSFLDSSRLDLAMIRKSEDSFVDYLFSDVEFMGAPMVSANFPRSFLDANREPYELDPKMFNGVLPNYVNIHSYRVAGGLGTIPRIAVDSQEIYKCKLEVNEGLDRIERYYKPYHQVLLDTIMQTHSIFGYAILIDCHSMPSMIKKTNQRYRPNIVIGDRYGTSCRPSLVNAVENIFVSLGYSVIRNMPFAGGFNTTHYGRPSHGIHAIQMEINRGLYLDESSLCLSENSRQLKCDLAEFTDQFASVVQYELGNKLIAAE